MKEERAKLIKLIYSHNLLIQSIIYKKMGEGYIRRGDLFETGYNVYCAILGGFSSSALERERDKIHSSKTH